MNSEHRPTLTRGRTLPSRAKTPLERTPSNKKVGSDILQEGCFPTSSLSISPEIDTLLPYLTVNHDQGFPKIIEKDKKYDDIEELIVPFYDIA